MAHFNGLPHQKKQTWMKGQFPAINETNRNFPHQPNSKIHDFP